MPSATNNKEEAEALTNRRGSLSHKQFSKEDDADVCTSGR